MSFSSKIKDELSRQLKPGQTLPDCGNRRNFRASAAGSRFSGDERYSIKIHTENVAGCKKMLYIIEKNI